MGVQEATPLHAKDSTRVRILGLGLWRRRRALLAKVMAAAMEGDDGTVDDGGGGKMEGLGFATRVWRCSGRERWRG